MGKEFDFKSQICTDRLQSERLLALGLKKETADMVYEPFAETPNLLEDSMWDVNCNVIVPAWSLHRLWELGNISAITLEKPSEISHLYDLVIANIELQINQGILNKEYLA